MAVTELKALAYDEQQKLSQAQQNLNIINQEINNRIEQENKPAKKEKK